MDDASHKFAAYVDYRASGRFEQDYDGFPTILVVTTNPAAEERIAQAVRTAILGWAARLPVLLTCDWRINRDPTNLHGLLGPVWREPDAVFHRRRRWALAAATAPAGAGANGPRDSPTPGR
jgi:hypothetical protein